MVGYVGRDFVKTSHRASVCVTSLYYHGYGISR
jgi:hypothetical protein